MGQNSVGFTVS